LFNLRELILKGLEEVLIVVQVSPILGPDHFQIRQRHFDRVDNEFVFLDVFSALANPLRKV
jgi:hypothetical protein